MPATLGVQVGHNCNNTNGGIRAHSRRYSPPPPRSYLTTPPLPPVFAAQDVGRGTRQDRGFSFGLAPCLHAPVLAPVPAPPWDVLQPSAALPVFRWWWRRALARAGPRGAPNPPLHQHPRSVRAGYGHPSLVELRSAWTRCRWQTSWCRVRSGGGTRWSRRLPTCRGPGRSRLSRDLCRITGARRHAGWRIGHRVRAERAPRRDRPGLGDTPGD